MSDKKPKEKEQIEEYDKFHLGNAISAHECTGLIQRAPQSEEELESYMELVDYKAPETETKIPET